MGSGQDTLFAIKLWYCDYCNYVTPEGSGEEPICILLFQAQIFQLTIPRMTCSPTKNWDKVLLILNLRTMIC